MNYIKTGGELNHINEKYGINNPKKCGFSMNNIINNNKFDSEEDLLNFIGKDKIQQYGKKLFEASIQENYQSSLEECINFQYSLFVVNSFKGFKMENKAYELFKQNYNVKKATSDIDCNYSVDLVIKHNDTIYGIQVKPVSYINMPKHKKEINIVKNNRFKTKYNAKVLYLFYSPNEEFTNIETILQYL
jgi:hypothetical protein